VQCRAEPEERTPFSQRHEPGNVPSVTCKVVFEPLWALTTTGTR
jgi:hypothetical protein